MFVWSHRMWNVDLKHVDKILYCGCLVYVDPTSLITMLISLVIKDFNRFCFITDGSASNKFVSANSRKCNTAVSVVTTILDYLYLIGTVAQVSYTDIAICSFK